MSSEGEAQSASTLTSESPDWTPDDDGTRPNGGKRKNTSVMVGGIVVLVVVFYWLLSAWVIGPLRKLSAAADRIADGDFQLRIDPQGRTDEFGRTIRALNRMALEIGEYQGHLEDRVLTALGRIKKAEQHLTIAQRLAATGKLASGLAHEINNPLGGMKNAVRSLSVARCSGRTCTSSAAVAESSSKTAEPASAA